MPKKNIILFSSFAVIIVLIIALFVLIPKENTPINLPDNNTYTYEIIGNGVKITGLKDLTIRELVIPDKISDFKVLSIGYDAFRNCTNIVDVKIKDNIEIIGNNAFDGCTGLEKIVIGDAVINIGDATFSNCTNLIDIKIENNVETIGNDAFNGCTKLKNVVIGNNIKIIGENVFNNCNAIESITIPFVGANLQNSNKFHFNYLFNGNIPSSLKSVVITGDMTNMSIGGFSNCSFLTSITIPDNVTAINDYAFFGCSSLTSFSVPDSVTSIGFRAFEGCTSLASISIPNSITNIGIYAFSGCKSLKYNEENNILYLGNEKNPYIIAIKAKLQNINEANVSSATKLIYDYAFSGCISLTSISIPDNIISIGYNAFFGCRSLSSISIPDSVTYIGDGAFKNCTSLTSISIPNSVTSIGIGAFYGCNSLKELIFNDSANWYYTDDDKNLFNYGTQCDLSSPAENAKIFTKQYCNYYWFKQNP